MSDFPKFKRRAGTSARVYRELSNRPLTADELRKIAYGDKKYDDGAITTLLVRLQRTIASHGQTICKGIGADKTYRIIKT